MIPFLTAPAGVQLLPGMHPVRPKCGPMLMGYTPVLPEWELGVWGYRGGHSPWWGAPQHTTIWSGWYLGLYFPIGVHPHSCQINSESCMGWKAHKMKGCRGLNNIFTRLGVTTEFGWGDTNDIYLLGPYITLALNRCYFASGVNKGRR